MSQSFIISEFGLRSLTPWIYGEAKKQKSLFILVDEANRNAKIARSYKINEKFLLCFCRIMTRKYAAANNKPAEMIDLFTDKPKPKRINQLTFCYDKSKNLITSKLVRDSIGCIGKMPYNKHFFEYHISQQEPKPRFIKYDIGKVNGNKLSLIKRKTPRLYIPSEDILTKEEKAHLIRDRAAIALMEQDSNEFYQQTLRPIRTGRVQEVGAGYQGIMRRSKAVLVHGQNLFNYDIVSAHPNIWLELLRQYERKALRKRVKPLATKYHECFRKRIANKRYLNYKAGKLKVETKDLKKMVLAFLYSGNMNATPIADARIKGMNMGKFNNFVQPIKLARQKLWEYICADPEFTDTNKKLKSVIVNAAGCKLNVEKSWSNQKTKKKVLAHLTQGAEKLFIHTLIIDCTNNGIPVVCDEHDGIVTKKPIPESLISSVQEKTNFRLNIVEKPFDSDPDVKQYYEKLKISYQRFLRVLMTSKKKSSGHEFPEVVKEILKRIAPISPKKVKIKNPMHRTQEEINETKKAYMNDVLEALDDKIKFSDHTLASVITYRFASSKKEAEVIQKMYDKVMPRQTKKVLRGCIRYF